MTPDAPQFWFDYVDPASYLAELRLREAEGVTGRWAERLGLEIVPPPMPPLVGDELEWAGRWEEVAEAGRGAGIPLERPRFVPWTRKAHELAMHAASVGVFAEVHDALFRAYLWEGQDIGRIDVLLGVAAGAGLSRSEVRTVLGVDRYLPTLLDLRERAERQGVRGVPTLAREERRLEGLTDVATLAALLAG